MSTPTTDRGGIEQVIRALRAAGWELDFVCDGEEDVPVKTELEATEEVLAVDDAYLNVKREFDETGQVRRADTGYVYFVMGNDPDEVVCDYTTNLESVIGPLTTSWFA